MFPRADEIIKNLWSVYDQLLKSENTKIKGLGLWANTPSAIISRTKLITKLSDVKGMKLYALA